MASGALQCLKLLMSTCADLNKPCEEFGAMAVFAAAQHRHLDVVHLLIQKGADMEKADYNGRTPLCIASQNGYLDVVRLLIEKGADIDKAENDGWTPVYVPSQNGHLDVVRFLIE